jgi:hypothetical protein
LRKTQSLDTFIRPNHPQQSLTTDRIREANIHQASKTQAYPHIFRRQKPRDNLAEHIRQAEWHTVATSPQPSASAAQKKQTLKPRAAQNIAQTHSINTAYIYYNTNKQMKKTAL